MPKKAKRKLSRSTLPMQRHLNLRHEGRCFDLREIFDRVNARHFRGRLRGYEVVWGRRRKERPKEYFIFGSIQEEDRVIRIHPLLDQPFVPRWFLEYVTLPRDAAFGGARRNEFSRSALHSYCRVLSPRTGFPALSPCAPVGSGKPRALSAVGITGRFSLGRPALV